MRSVKFAVLISASPRRKEILAAFVPKLKVVIPKAEERPIRSKADLIHNARAKLASVKTPKADFVISADTAVFLGRTVMGKPGSPKLAKAMLRKLSGKWHTVMTGIVINAKGRVRSAVVTTRVHFRKLSDKAIAGYVRTGEPLDKAGAYGIQGLGGHLIDRIDGDYFNVVGLPIYKVEEILEDFGYTFLGM